MEKACDDIDTPAQLRESKIFIFNHIFSLQKENRALLRRIKSNEHKSKKGQQEVLELSLTEEKSEENALLALKAMRGQTTAVEQEVHEEPS